MPHIVVNEVFGITFFILATIFIVFQIVKQVTELVARYGLRKRAKWLEGLKSELSRKGIRLITNSSQGVLAVVSAEDFEKELRIYASMVSLKEVNSWDAVEIKPVRTFTFHRSTSAYRPVHTGNSNSFERCLKLLINTNLQLGKETLSRSEFEELANCILQRDSRLFVPFAGMVTKAKEQYEYYGEHSFVEFEVEVIRPLCNIK